MIKKDSSIPMYIQVSEDIKKMIKTRKIIPGGKLYTQQGFMDYYKTSKITIIKAIRDLENKGFVISKQGKGTYVNPYHYTEELKKLQSFKEVFNGLEDSVKIKVVQFDYIKTPKLIYWMFNPPVQETLRIGRIHINTRQDPIAFVKIYIPRDIANKITKDDVSSLSIYTILKNTEEIQVVEAIQKIYSHKAEGEVEKNLQVKHGTPVLVSERTSFNQEGRIVVYAVFYYRYDMYSFMIKLKRDN